MLGEGILRMYSRMGETLMPRNRVGTAALAVGLSVILTLVAAIGLAAPSEEGKSRSPFEGDARLQKRVTLEMAKAPLNEALAEVTRQTGVRLIALERAADEPVALYVKEQPAAEVLRQIAELLGYWWSRRGTADDWRYELFQDLRSKNEEAAILTGARRAVINTLQAELGRHRRLAQLPSPELKQRVDLGDAELAKLMGQGGGMSFGGPGRMAEGLHEWQAARNVSQPQGQIMLEVLERLTPAQWQTLLAGDAITYSSDPKPGELRLSPEMVTRLRDSKPASALPAGVAQALGPEVTEAFRKLEEKAAEEWGRASGYRLDIQLTLSMGSQPVGMLRAAPQPLSATPGLSMLSGLNIMAMPELDPAAAKEEPEARKARLAADPVLAKKGRLPPATKASASFMPFLQRTGDLLQRIAAGYQTNIVADAYTSGSISMGGAPPSTAPPAPGAAAAEGEPLYALLDRSFGHAREWKRDGDCIRLRSRTWAFDRNLEIPARLMRQWAADWKARNGWDLDQLAAIVDTLRSEQIMTFELAAQEYEIPSGGQLFMPMMSADALRLYAHLLPSQRQALMAGQSLPLGSLTPGQRGVRARSRPRPWPLHRPDVHGPATVALPAGPGAGDALAERDAGDRQVWSGRCCRSGSLREHDCHSCSEGAGRPGVAASHARAPPADGNLRASVPGGPAGDLRRSGSPPPGTPLPAAEQKEKEAEPG